MVDQSDTWSHEYDEWRVEAGRFGQAALELLEMGDVRATVRVVSHFNKSKVDQFVTICRDTPDIDCRFRVNWQEQYTMLKLAYETNIVEGKAMYDAPYGCQERPNEGFEEPGQKWIDLSGKVGETVYGLGLLNDSKYGFDTRDGVMRITMLRSPAYAHHDRTRFTASEPYPIMDQGWHDIRVRLVPHTRDWAAAGVPRASWELNEPPLVHIESAHPGDLPAWASFLSCSADNVVLSVMKRSEDGDDLIVRGYETAGQQTEAVIQLPQFGKSFTTTFAPHEIKTLRIGRADWKAREVNLLEE
jgi:alpha-mannosidase